MSNLRYKLEQLQIIATREKPHEIILEPTSLEYLPRKVQFTAQDTLELCELALNALAANESSLEQGR